MPYITEIIFMTENVIRYNNNLIILFQKLGQQ